jgi:hypothetical protein
MAWKQPYRAHARYENEHYQIVKPQGKPNAARIFAIPGIAGNSTLRLRSCGICGTG